MTRDSRTRLVVPPERDGERLDVFLADAAGLSRRRARSLIAAGAVYRNQRPVRVQSRLLATGDVVALPTEEIPADAAVWSPPPVDIVFEDRWLVVVDKASGVLTQPSETSRGGTELALDEILLLNLALRDGRPPFLRTVHRLDRLTSGLVLFARSREILPALDRTWRSGRVERVYLAVVEGRVASERGFVEAPIARDRGHAWRFTVDDSGKPARTEFRVLDSDEERSVLVCRLDTGRTHQVRVHLAHLGHPVAGDRLYGSATPGCGRPMLHAWGLKFPHPRERRPLRLTAPIPEPVRALCHAALPDEPWDPT